MCYHRTKNLAKLTFLYTITGNMEKLEKMLRIAGTRKDISHVSPHYCTTLVLGDVRERVRLLKSSGQIPLACWTAINHGLTEETDQLRELLDEEQLENLKPEPNAKLLCPPSPLFVCDENWPLLTVTRVKEMQKSTRHYHKNLLFIAMHICMYAIIFYFSERL